MAPKSILMVIMIKYSSLGVRFLLSGFSDFPFQCTHMDYVKSSDPEIHTGQGEKVCSWHFHIPYCDFSFSNNSVAWLEQGPCCRCPLPWPVFSKSLPRLRHFKVLLPSTLSLNCLSWAPSSKGPFLCQGMTRSSACTKGSHGFQCIMSPI